MRLFRWLFDWIRKTDKAKLGDHVRLPWPEDHLVGTVASFGASSNGASYVVVRLHNGCFVEWGRSELIILQQK